MSILVLRWLLQPSRPIRKSSGSHPIIEVLTLLVVLSLLGGCHG